MGGYVTQTRKSPGGLLIPFKRETFTPGSGWATVSSGIVDTAAQVGSQVTTSYRSSGDIEGDSIFRGGNWGSAMQAIRSLERERGTEWDNGHTFNTVRSEHIMSHPGVVLTRPIPGTNRTDRLSGPLRVVVTPLPTAPDHTGLTALGTRAISQTKPGDSPANVAQALIELKREGLPRLFGASTFRNRASVARSAGDEYLNVEFGWRPLVRDIVDTALAAAESERILNDYHRNSGVNTRRERTFDPIVTQTFSQGTGAVNNLAISSINAFQFHDTSQARWTQQTKTTVSVYFVGSYTYYAPSNLMESGVIGSIQRANYLFGLELTPELLWNIAPWTWLSDWFVNIGDIISNVSAFSADSTVLRYAYIMATTVVERTYTMKVFPLTGVTGLPSFVSTTVRTIRKQRQRATPYGFGLNPTTFTGRQWAILGALGLTRGNRSLRYSE